MIMCTVYICEFCNDPQVAPTNALRMHHVVAEDSNFLYYKSQKEFCDFLSLSPTLPVDFTNLVRYHWVAVVKESDFYITTIATSTYKP